jgi:hypothetical protein
MIKTLIIGAYVAHKIWWKRQNRQVTIAFKTFVGR